jgi:hypothetical protein
MLLLGELYTLSVIYFVYNYLYYFLFYSFEIRKKKEIKMRRRGRIGKNRGEKESARAWNPDKIMHFELYP